MGECRILLVDDEYEFASALAERLSMRGIQVHTASTGEEALELLVRENPSVVILDLMMPGMNGLVTLERMKKLRADVEVILLTGMGSTKQAIEGMRLGAFDYLMKPIHIEVLLGRIRDAIARSEGGEQ
jgi:DNA-binding response OmpR family regulator